MQRRVRAVAKTDLRPSGPPRKAPARAPGSASRSVEETNRWMLRARDAIDREYARPLDIRALAKIAAVSEAHFIRTFRATFGETPHRYLQRRRVERAMALLRLTDRSVTDICFDVGFTSLGTFSRTFRAIVGRSPSAFRSEAAAEPVPPVPTCFAMAWNRPSSFGEATGDRSP
jgi:AraC-like DNA-binding protein